MKTTQITLRNIDERLKKLIDQNARKQHKSINTYIVDIVKKAVGYTSDTPTWEKFRGAIPSDGINQDTLDEQEYIDETMWQ